MKIKLRFILIFLVITLLITTPVSAGFWDLFLKSSVKKTEKQIVKQEEKFVIKEFEEKEIKQEQIKINNYNGRLLEDAFKLKWCNTNRCVNTFYGINRNIKLNGDFYITNDNVAKEFINKYYDRFFTRKPDMIKVNTFNGKIEHLVIYDVKTSTNAVTASTKRGQTDDYLKLCNLLNKKYSYDLCEIQYVLPKKEAKGLAQNKGSAVLGCLAVGLIMVPDPTDLLCFVGS